MKKAEDKKERILLVLYQKVYEKKLELEERFRRAQRYVGNPEAVEPSQRNVFREEKQRLACNWDKRKREYSQALEVISEVLVGRTFLDCPENVAVLSLVKLRYYEESQEVEVFIFPYMGGEKIDDVFVVSPQTNLIQAIQNKRIGDDFKMGERIGEILEIQ